METVKKTLNIMTPVGVAHYAKLFEASKNELSGKDEYSVVLVFKKGTDLTALKKHMENAAIKKWGSDKTKWPKNMRTPLRSHSDRAQDSNGTLVYPPGYEEGGFYLNLRSTTQPGLVDQKVQPIIDKTELYSGCEIRCTVTCYAYSHKGNNGVAFGLVNVQKVRDGQPLARGAIKPENEFSAIESADDGSMDTSGMFS